MGQRLVIAHHLIWTTYGWWLPNDPRGSGSNVVRNDLLRELGELHHGRKAVQPVAAEIREFYQEAHPRLSSPAVSFTATERDVIGNRFRDAIVEQRYTCYACAIMPDHVHVLIRKHRDRAERMMDNLKAAGAAQLFATGLRPIENRIWTDGGGWKVFLHHPDDVRRTITYIDNNPTRAGEPKQQWDFVMEYDGWPLHPGHSPNSPYAKRLRALGEYP